MVLRVRNSRKDVLCRRQHGVFVRRSRLLCIAAIFLRVEHLLSAGDVSVIVALEKKLLARAIAAIVVVLVSEPSLLALPRLSLIHI